MDALERRSTDLARHGPPPPAPHSPVRPVSSIYFTDEDEKEMAEEDVVVEHRVPKRPRVEPPHPTLSDVVTSDEFFRQFDGECFVCKENMGDAAMARFKCCGRAPVCLPCAAKLATKNWSIQRNGTAAPTVDGYPHCPTCGPKALQLTLSKCDNIEILRAIRHCQLKIGRNERISLDIDLRAASIPCTHCPALHHGSDVDAIRCTRFGVPCPDAECKHVVEMRWMGKPLPDQMNDHLASADHNALWRCHLCAVVPTRGSKKPIQVHPSLKEAHLVLHGQIMATWLSNLQGLYVKYGKDKSDVIINLYYNLWQVYFGEYSSTNRKPGPIGGSIANIDLLAASSTREKKTPKRRDAMVRFLELMHQSYESNSEDLSMLQSCCYVYLVDSFDE